MIYIFNICKNGRYNEYLIGYFLEYFLKYSELTLGIKRYRCFFSVSSTYFLFSLDSLCYYRDVTSWIVSIVLISYLLW